MVCGAISHPLRPRSGPRSPSVGSRSSSRRAFDTGGPGDAADLEGPPRRAAPHQGPCPVSPFPPPTQRAGLRPSILDLDSHPPDLTLGPWTPDHLVHVVGCRPGVLAAVLGERRPRLHRELGGPRLVDAGVHHVVGGGTWGLREGFWAGPPSRRPLTPPALTRYPVALPPRSPPPPALTLLRSSKKLPTALRP